MRHTVYADKSNYDIAVLIKTPHPDKERIDNFYLKPAGINKESVVIYPLAYNPNNKAPVKLINEYLDSLMPRLREAGVKTLFVCDNNYYKKLANKPKPASEVGYVHPCAIKGYEDIHVIVCSNYQATFYNPSIQDSINLAVETLRNHLEDTYEVIGQNVIHSAIYPETYSDIEYYLSTLHQYPELQVDVETFSLKFYEAGIATIGFSWDKHNGISFAVDYVEIPKKEDSPFYGKQQPNPKVKRLLKKFFEDYKGKLVFHHANFDTKVMVYELFMKAPLDTEGMIHGIKTLCRKLHDTKLIAYLALNTTSELKLDLKTLAHRFAGNYAQGEINDVRRIPLPMLREYNLVDCLATAYVKEKYLPIMIQDEQNIPYREVFLPSVPMLLHTELCGMPLDMDRVKEVDKQLQAEELRLLGNMRKTSVAKSATIEIRRLACEAKNKKLKKKRVTVDDFKSVHFNPGSPKQLSYVLYDMLGLPILARTKTKQPAADAKTLAKLVNHTTTPDVKEFIQSILELSKVTKILSTFIKAFYENSVQKEDGWWYLHGNFNIGGTVSGRLSSSGPNLQNLPSGSTYGKLIKSCFVPPPGWLFVGADFASLEDRISALTTKDPNKLKVYTDGYDGHCLRAYGYFKDQMPDIVDTVQSINSIEAKYPDLRQDSKAPTFALTYQGTWHTLVSNLGWSKKKSQSVEDNYHKLYAVSGAWVAAKLEKACADGYVTTAFGLRVRTPILAKTILGNAVTPYEAAAEGRTAGNALGQGYGLLNNRAAIELQRRLFKSEFTTMVKPSAHIHDSQYFMVRDNIHSVHWLNKNLTECLAWQGLPEIQHPTVKLGGSMDIYYPSWANAITLPETASKEDIKRICKEN